MSEPARKIKQTPESYTPKNKPEILNMMEQSTMKMKPQAEIKPAASTIPQEKRNNVRIIELPACNMVTSGAINDPGAFAPDGIFARFLEWFQTVDKQRTDLFYPRNFMWSPPDGGFEWGYAVPEVPEDTGGFDVIDFPGGLYAVAISVDADGADHDRVYNGILEWVNNSGCFVLDETDERRSLGNITSPPGIKKIIGYDQMDLYFPIRIKEAQN
ncbi:MAG: GyrI-like domain-containing protein [Defluviitaleaceae bacterium]|nr:GyrI-like domain-containing protein [Defluviitaleaceae bacterium]